MILSPPNVSMRLASLDVPNPRRVSFVLECVVLRALIDLGDLEFVGRVKRQSRLVPVNAQAFLSRECLATCSGDHNKRWSYVDSKLVPRSSRKDSLLQHMAYLQ